MANAIDSAFNHLPEQLTPQPQTKIDKLRIYLLRPKVFLKIVFVIAVVILLSSFISWAFFEFWNNPAQFSATTQAVSSTPELTSITTTFEVTSTTNILTTISPEVTTTPFPTHIPPEVTTPIFTSIAPTSYRKFRNGI